MFSKYLRIACPIFASAIFVSTGAVAQNVGQSDKSFSEYPQSAVRFIVPFSPGSGNDIVSGMFAQLLAESFKQPFVVENRGGGGGTIGGAQIAKAEPDGYTIGMGSASSLAIAPYVMKKAPYDPIHDLAPVTLIGAAPFLVVVTPNFPANSFREFIAYAKANPGKINYGSAGIGTTNNLAVEVLNQMAKVKMTHVPYKGAAPATTAVMAGNIQMTFGPILSTVGLIKSKKLKVLAVTSGQRASKLSDVPTIAESGYPEYEYANWYGVVAPGKTPTAILEKLSSELIKHLATPVVRDKLESGGAIVMAFPSKKFGEFIRKEAETSRRVISELNLRAK